MHGIVLDIECSKIIFFENGTKEEKKRATSCRGQLHHDCENHLSSLFFFFFLFFQMRNVDPDSRILLSRGDEKYGSMNHRVLINYMLAKENMRELLIVSLTINFLDSFFLILGFLIFIF